MPKNSRDESAGRNDCSKSAADGLLNWPDYPAPAAFGPGRHWATMSNLSTLSNSLPVNSKNHLFQDSLPRTGLNPDSGLDSCAEANRLLTANHSVRSNSSFDSLLQPAGNQPTSA